MVKDKKTSIYAPEPKVYQVEVITKARVAFTSSDGEAYDDDDDVYDSGGSGGAQKKGKKKGKKKRKSSAAGWEYFVKWAGYDSDENSWEPEGNVAGCQRLLDSFWGHIGTDDGDYPVGYEVRATDKWIRKEKKFFAAEFSSTQEKLRVNREREERERTKKMTQVKKPKARSTDIMRQSFSSLSNAHTTSKKSPSMTSGHVSDSDASLTIILPAKRKRAVTVSSSDEDSIPITTVVEASPSIMKAGMSSETIANKNNPAAIAQPPPRRAEAALTSLTQKPTMDVPIVGATDKGKRKAAEQPPPAAQVDHTSAASLFSEPSYPSRSLTSVVSTVKPLASSAKITPTIPPKIPRRGTNPHLKIAEMAPQPLASGSGISTKQRLSQGALAPTLPKALSLPKGRPQLPPVKTNSSTLMALSFKKKPQTPVLSAGGGGSTSSHIPTDDGKSPAITPQIPFQQYEPTLASLNAPPLSHDSAPMSPMSQLHESHRIAASPEDQTSAFFDPFASSETMSPRLPHQPVIDERMAQAEDFLQSIMPSALAAPLTPVAELTHEPMLPRSLARSNPKSIPPQRIPKKWKWSGSIYIDATGGRSKPLCNVTFCDLTDPVPMGMRFNVAMATMDFLDFPSFHDVVDLDLILLACKPVQQFARLAPQEAKDVDPLTVLLKYMDKKQKVILVPVSLDENIVGHIILFPHAMKHLCQRLKVPQEVQQAGSLVAALVPWTLTPTQLSHDWRKPPSTYLPADTDMVPTIADKARWERSIRTKPTYHHALRILQFPLELHEFLSQEGRDRSFYIWWESGDGTKKDPGMETLLLFSIMEQCRAKNAGHRADVRVVFIHVGALKTLNLLPRLAERRSKNLEKLYVQFYTYGTHESVVPENWGIREIYPIGGIVTFTPKSIVDDPEGVSKMIKQAHEHPLWLCYILPSVLGMAVKLGCGNEDPLGMLNRGDFPYQFILTAIEEGELALIYAPPHDRAARHDGDKNMNWCVEHWSRHPRGAPAILEKGINAFNAKYANVEKSAWSSTIESEVSSDLRSMQMHSCIMSTYRRYVIFKSSRDDHIAWNRDGLEWSTPADFDFQDDFFAFENI